MNERLRWWMLPAAMVVLLRVLTLGGSGAGADGYVPVVEAAEPGGTVAVLEASGQRTVPLPLPATGEALVVAVPAEHAGRRGAMTLWRHLADGREGEPWLELRPRVLADATIKIAGLAAGRYDVELRLGDAVLGADQVAAPGHIVLQPLSAQPPR
jgi:hypothetical protein